MGSSHPLGENQGSRLTFVVSSFISIPRSESTVQVLLLIQIGDKVVDDLSLEEMMEGLSGLGIDMNSHPEKLQQFKEQMGDLLQKTKEEVGDDRKARQAFHAAKQEAGETLAEKVAGTRGLLCITPPPVGCHLFMQSLSCHIEQNLLERNGTRKYDSQILIHESVHLTPHDTSYIFNALP